MLLRSLSRLLIVAGSVVAQNASFSLYPNVDSARLASALGISEQCLLVLNTTLPCDQTLLQMAGSVDNYLWTSDNLTDLCTKDCFGAVEDWDSAVQISCQDDEIVTFGKNVPVDSVSGRTVDGIHIACLTNGDSPDDEDHAWCLLESQDWVGSDVVRPDCDTDPSDPSCNDPTDVSPDNERMANLYDDDVLCSNCFIQLLYQRLNSLYLPNHDYSDYLIAQYQDILDVCNYSAYMPELVIQVAPDYTTAAPPALNLSSPSADCNGQLIIKSTLDPNANCQSLSSAFNVATGAIQWATGSSSCAISDSSVCLPAACDLYQVPDGATCDSLASTFSTNDLTVTSAQFLAWNPFVAGLCDDLVVGDQVCSGPPGGSYIPPPPPAGTVNGSSYTRGGNSGSDAGDGTGLSPSGVGSNAPSPTQSGIVTDCDRFDQPADGEGCEAFAQAHNITTGSLYKWNAVLGHSGADCGAKFQLGYYYCIDAGGAVPPVPTPTQDGIVDSCDSYAQAQDGEYCSLFADEHNVTTANLYTWNTVLGANGEHCDSSFYKGYYYCIGVGVDTDSD